MARRPTVPAFWDGRTFAASWSRDNLGVIAPSEVASTMRSIGVWWAIAGGWAIDLWLGYETRVHHDVEVVVKRSDQHRVHAALAGQWDLFCLDPPGSGWQPWSGHTLERPAFQLEANHDDQAFDVFLEDIDDDGWRYRRDNSIRLEVEHVVTISGSNIPVVRPEIQLLYMATSTDPKNAADFAVATPRLDGPARQWLQTALSTSHPGHPWIDTLTNLA